MALTPEQIQKFKFRARLEAEQAAAAQTQTPAPQPVTPEAPRAPTRAGMEGVIDPNFTLTEPPKTREETYERLFATEPNLINRAGDISARIAETPRGILDLPQTLGSLAGYGGEWLGLLNKGATDRTLGKPFTQREGAVKDFFDTATKPVINRELNPATRALGTAASWAMPLPVSKMTKVATTPDLMMGGGAAAGEYLGDTTGEVLGGFGGLITGLLRGKLNAPSVDKATEQAEDFTTKMLGDTAEESVDKINKLKEGGELDNFSLADATENPTMYDVEKTLATPPEGATLRQDLEQMVARAEADTLAKTTDVIPTASAGPARLAAETKAKDAKAALDAERIAKTEELEAGLNAQKNTARALEGQMGRELSESKDLVSALRAEADEAQGVVAGAKTPVNASRSIFDEYNTLEENMNVPMKEAYEVIEAAPKVDASKAVKAMTSAYKELGLDPRNAKNFTGKYSEYIAEINKWLKKPVTPSEITSVIRDMKQEVSNTYANKNAKYSEVVANKVIKALEDAVNVPENVSGFSGFADATKAAAAKFAATSPEAVGTARKANIPETFTDALNYTGKTGARTAVLAKQADDPAVLQGHLDVIAADAKEAAMYGGKGVDDAFMKKYSGFLGEFPDEKAKYQKMADANKAAETAATEGKATQSALTKAVTASQKATTSAKKGLEASVKKLEDITKTAKADVDRGVVETFSREPKDFVTNLISPKQDKKRTENLTELMDWSRAEGLEDSVKGEVKDVLMDRLFPEGGTGLRQATAASAKAFKPAKDRLVKSGILTQKEADGIEKALQSNAGRQAAREAAGQTQVSAKLTPEQKRLAGIAAVTAVSTTGIPHALFAVGFTRRMIEQTMVNMKMSDEGKAKMAEFITNPEKYAEAYEMMKKINAAKTQPSDSQLANVARAIVGAGNINKSED